MSKPPPPPLSIALCEASAAAFCSVIPRVVGANQPWSLFVWIFINQESNLSEIGVQTQVEIPKCAANQKWDVPTVHFSQ